MLINARDWQSVLYLLTQPLIVLLLWCGDWSWPITLVLYGMLLFLSLGISVIHHNHTHRKMWRNKWRNRITDFWITALQGHPTFVFYPAHIANHHRYHHGERDAARTYRFGGDTNHLLGYLLHPLQAAWILYPLFIQWLAALQRRSAGAFYYCLAQYALVALIWLILAVLDWQKFMLLVLIPQLHGLHWLLATNYLQHAHADGHSDLNFARNFAGWVNPLLFNIGLHTAHHKHPRAHWSELNDLHCLYHEQIHPQLNAGSLLPYMFRTFILGLLHPRWRSHSLMNSGKPHAD